MKEPLFIAFPSGEVSDQQKHADRKVLEQAVAKIVLLGEQVHVSADEMIALLNSGMTVGELLEYLLTKAGEIA